MAQSAGLIEVRWSDPDSSNPVLLYPNTVEGLLLAAKRAKFLNKGMEAHIEPQGLLNPSQGPSAYVGTTTSTVVDEANGFTQEDWDRIRYRLPGEPIEPVVNILPGPYVYQHHTNQIN